MEKGGGREGEGGGEGRVNRGKGRGRGGERMGKEGREMEGRETGQQELIGVDLLHIVMT